MKGRTPGVCIDQFNQNILDLYEKHNDNVIGLTMQKEKNKTKND